jgi:hypothetical protein
MALPLETGHPGKPRDVRRTGKPGASRVLGIRGRRALSGRPGNRPDWRCEAKARPFHLIRGGALWHSARYGSLRRADTPLVVQNKDSAAYGERSERACHPR